MFLYKQWNVALCLYDVSATVSELCECMSVWRQKGLSIYLKQFNQSDPFASELMLFIYALLLLFHLFFSYSESSWNTAVGKRFTLRWGCNSLFIPGLPKFAHQCYSTEPGNLSNLGSNKEIEPQSMFILDEILIITFTNG